MTSTFLQLTNRVLKAFNEVPLDSSTFSSAGGFHADVQDSINQAIFDIFTYEDSEWPFLWSTTTLNTVVGQTDYTRTDNYTGVNWDTFRIKRGTATCYTLTQTGGTATFTSTANHNFLTGDLISVSGATPDGYNGQSIIITVTGTTTFTYDVDSTTSTPASGTITALSQVVLQHSLQLKSWEQYAAQGFWDTDQNTNSTGYSIPVYVVRKPDNNIYLGRPADRIYTISYEGFTFPAALSLYSDTTIVPVPFEQVIIDKALHYAYMFRDNIEEASIVEQRYKDNITKMRRILIPQEKYAITSD